MENFDNKQQVPEAGSTNENLDLTRNKMVQFEKDNLTVAASGIENPEAATEMKDALEALSTGAGNKKVQAKFEEIKGRKEESFNQKM
ncbi:MAG: hypothetical protein WCO55_04725 [Candidatus Falkowbacteria bacterium]